MMSSKYRWLLAGWLLCAAMLAGCAGAGIEGSSSDVEERESGAEVVETAALREREAIRYYIDKLPDRDYIETYGGDEHPRPWYTAAEALGEIGKPAIPALMERLDTQDPYELKLALYALMLASQDSALQAETGGDYLRLDSVLSADGNAKNRRRALDWWQRYRHLWL